MIYPWLNKPWLGLQRRRLALPHALLLRGKAGLGKTVLARTFAQGLLCEKALTDGLPCGACAPCNWFLQGNHPDFRQIEPEALSVVAGGETGQKTTETPSRQIKIDQIRELQGFLAIGTHRGGLRIVIVRPAEAMNAATANALLKSLEEPLPHTLFLLVTSDPQRLLPTIRSRCQAIDIPPPDTASALSWLRSQGVREPETALAYAGNAPCRVLEEAADAPLRERLVAELVRTDLDPVAAADRTQTIETALFVDMLQKWLYDLARVKSGAAPRYHPHQVAALQRQSASIATMALLGLWQEFGRARATVQHPLNARLFKEDLFIKLQALHPSSDG